MRRKLPFLLGAAVAGFCAMLVSAQRTQPSPSARPRTGVMRLSAGLGSFMLEGEGQLEINFTGTLLLSQISGSVNVTGKVRTEFEGMRRRVWFGTGKAVVQGRWRRLQWFGRDMNAVWKGRGTALVYGEFDETGSPGVVQVDDLAPQKWEPTGEQHYVPKELNPAWQYIKDRVPRLR